MAVADDIAETPAPRAPRAGRPESAIGDQEFMQSLAKGLAVIEAFSERTPQMTLSDVSRRVGLSPGSARRVLHTLEVLGYATSRGTRFELTPRVLQLGYAYLTALPVANLVRPRLSELTEELGANCGVSVLDGADVVFVARTTSRHTARERLGVGTRFPAHTTSAGKVLLADMPLEALRELLSGRPLEALTVNSIASVEALYETLEQVRIDGWAFNDQETMIGHRSITVPVRVGGKAIAAVGVGAHIGVASVARMKEEFLPALQTAADQIAQLLRDHPSSIGARQPVGQR